MSSGATVTWAGAKPLDRVADAMQNAVNAAYEKMGSAAVPVANALHGTWLGHPLHAALTDIPVGAWTVAAAMDTAEAVTGRKEYGEVADQAVGIGILGAVAAAAAGITDWRHTNGEARRIGAAHAMLNTAALGLYATSWVLRKRRDRAAARLWGLAAFGIANLAAWLGGNLSYTRKVGMDHSPKDLPQDWTDAAAGSELVEGRLKRGMAGGTAVVLLRRGGHVLALAGTCSHMGGPLAEGSLEGDVVRCPWHGSCFDMGTGRVEEGPAVHPQPCLEARVENGRVQVRAAARD